MTTRQLPMDERIVDMLADEATVGISRSDLTVIDSYFVDHPESDRDGLMMAAAAIDLAMMPPVTAAPQDLVKTLEMQADLHFKIDRREREAIGARSSAMYTSVRIQRFAIAALLLIAVGGWWSALSKPASPAASLTPLEQLALLESQSSDLVRAEWASSVDGYSATRGGVVWSDAEQAGFMRLSGLPANDPSVAQYQLWIVDPGRDTKPVDGGVFDVLSDREEAIVRIDAKLRVEKPSVFAITLEKPGGVVVSDGPLLIIASTDG